MCKRMSVLVAVSAMILGLAPVGRADSIPVPMSDWSGFRTTPNLDGVFANPAGSSWAHSAGGVRITWLIELSGSVFTYKWTLSRADGTAFTDAEPSHSIFETSTDFTSADILAGSSSPIEGPKTFSPGPGNPGMPAEVFGIKFDFGGSLPMYVLKTTRSPVWGDFYAKDGGENSAWNTGFGTDPTSSTTDFTNWIPTPDTTVIPLPAAAWMGMALMGSIGGVGFIRHRRRHVV